MANELKSDIVASTMLCQVSEQTTRMQHKVNELESDIVVFTMLGQVCSFHNAWQVSDQSTHTQHMVRELRSDKHGYPSKSTALKSVSLHAGLVIFVVDVVADAAPAPHTQHIDIERKY